MGITPLAFKSKGIPELVMLPDQREWGQTILNSPEIDGQTCLTQGNCTDTTQGSIITKVPLRPVCKVCNNLASKILPMLQKQPVCKVYYASKQPVCKVTDIPSFETRALTIINLGELEVLTRILKKKIQFSWLTGLWYLLFFTKRTFSFRVKNSEESHLFLQSKNCSNIIKMYTLFRDKKELKVF